MKKAYFLNANGDLEMTMHYDPRDADMFTEEECAEIEFQCDHDKRLVLDLHGKVYAIHVEENNPPILLADYSDEIADELAFPKHPRR